MSTLDGYRLTPHRRKLVADNISLAYWVARSFRQTGEALDRDNDTAVAALCYAAWKYQPKRGAKFITFATIVIRSQLLNSRRGKQPFPTVPMTSGVVCNAEATEAEDLHYLEREDVAKKVRYVIHRRLPNRLKTAAAAWLDAIRKGKSKLTVAKKLGVAPPTMRLYEREIARRLQPYLEGCI